MMVQGVIGGRSDAAAAVLVAMFAVGCAPADEGRPTPTAPAPTERAPWEGNTAYTDFETCFLGGGFIGGDVLTVTPYSRTAYASLALVGANPIPPCHVNLLLKGGGQTRFDRIMPGFTREWFTGLAPDTEYRLEIKAYKKEVNTLHGPTMTATFRTLMAEPEPHNSNPEPQAKPKPGYGDNPAPVGMYNSAAELCLINRSNCTASSCAASGGEWEKENEGDKICTHTDP